MTETERQIIALTKIRLSAHSKFNLKEFKNNSLVRAETNCFALAIGSTYPYSEMYRLGTISGLRAENQEISSIEEMKEFFLGDMKTLDLKVAESSEEETLSDNQYKIALFAKIYANDKICDYHFIRLIDNKWVEKRLGFSPRTLDGTLKELYNYWPWNFVGVYKVTM